MPVSREIAGLDAARASRQTGLESLMREAGGRDLGGGKFGFKAPNVDKSFEIAKQRAEIAAQSLADKKARQLAAATAFGAGNEMLADPNAEASFMAPGLVMDTYAPPGYAEAGHRRFEDRNPRYEENYRRAYMGEQFRRERLRP